MHYRHHFKLQLCSSKHIIADSSFSSIQAVSNDNITNTTDTMQKQTSLKKWQCVCKFKSIDDETFGFFPSSFCCYIAFNILLYIILIIKFFTNHTNFVDYILFYGMMIVYVWESLFAFYRYYTTKISAITFSSASLKTIITKFLFYIFFYISICCIYIHIFYYIYPLLILLHSISNIYCNYTFASILIKRYTIFLKISEFHSDLNPINRQHDIDILQSIHFMRKISLLANIISTISLTIFLYSHQIETLYYVSILLSISIFIFSMNFIRNRKYILQYTCCMRRNEPTLNLTANVTATTPVPINQEQIDQNAASISPFSPSNAFPDTEKISNANYTININKNKHNYDKFNALVETLNDDNTTPPLATSTSDHRHNKKPKPLKRKHNSNPVKFTAHVQQMQLQPQLQIYNDTGTQSKSDYKTDENTNTSSSGLVVVDQYSELTPVPMDSPINNIASETNHRLENVYVPNHRLENQYVAKSNPVHFAFKNDTITPLYSNVRISPLPKPLANHRSAPPNGKHHFDFDDEYDDDKLTDVEKQLQRQIQNRGMSRPSLNPFKLSNSKSVISTIETIKKKLKWENKNENDNLIDEKEDIISNIDILMTTSFHILAKDGFYATKDLRVVHDKNRKNISNHRAHTPMSQKINRENGSFLTPPKLPYIRQNSV